MATLGAPTKDEDGRRYQRWYPVEGNIRPEGLELRVPGVDESWGLSLKTGHPIGQGDVEQCEYRIPSTYEPPAGWYCVPNEETVREGDAASHWPHGDQHSEPYRLGEHCINVLAKNVREYVMPNGGWVLRREPTKAESCKSESVHCAKETASGSSSSGRVDRESESKEDAPTATAPVAWQFRRQPMERVVDHYRLLEVGKDAVTIDCIRWNGSTFQDVDKLEVGLPVYSIVPVCRPVYAPLPTRIEDVPDGRVFEIKYNKRWYFKGCGLFWIIWGQVTINTNNPMLSRDAVKDMQADLNSKFTITDYVAELKAVE